MRHFSFRRVLEAIAALTAGMPATPLGAGLVASCRGAQTRPARQSRAGRGAVALAAIAEAAKEEDLAASGSSADDKPKRFHASPGQGHKGLDNSGDLWQNGLAESRPRDLARGLGGFGSGPSPYRSPG